MDLKIIPVWREVTPELQAELAAFWLANKAIAEPERANARARQAVCVLRDADGTLCGVATAMLRILPRLRQPMYYFRMFIAPDYRQRQQALPIFRAACQVLEAANAARPESLGVLLEVENPHLNRIFSHAVGARTGAAFIGYSPRGHQLRVVYFKGAKLFAPAPLARKVVRRAVPAAAPAA